MGSLERVMARDAIAQVMADAGINRNTIKEMVEKVISEKVDAALKNFFEVQSAIMARRFEEKYRETFERALTNEIRRALPCVTVTINHVGNSKE